MSSERAAKWKQPSSSWIEGVAGQVPAVADIVLLALVGEIAAAGRPAHGEPADRAARHLVHVVVDDPRLVAGRPAGRCVAGCHVVEPVGDEDVQHLGRADAVEDRLAGLLRPFLEDRRRQRLAGRHRDAQRRQVGALVHGREHGAIGGRRGEADRRPVGLDDLDHVRRRGVFQQRRRGAEAQRKDRQPAETEGEGERRRADEHVVRASRCSTSLA